MHKLTFEDYEHKLKLEETRKKVWLVWPPQYDSVNRMSQSVWWNIEHRNASLCRDKYNHSFGGFVSEIILF